MKKTAIMLAALLMSSITAHAEAKMGTGNLLLAGCQSDTIEQMYCIGYVDGVVGQGCSTLYSESVKQQGQKI